MYVVWIPYVMFNLFFSNFRIVNGYLVIPCPIPTHMLFNRVSVSWVFFPGGSLFLLAPFVIIGEELRRPSLRRGEVVLLEGVTTGKRVGGDRPHGVLLIYVAGSAPNVHQRPLGNERHINSAWPSVVRKGLRACGT